MAMNARSLRRLAGDHGTLHSSPLPPNYFFPPSSADDPSSDLTKLDILLVGPTSTPYETGMFKLHLSIPVTYPNEPPKAFFRTKIFHPNVDDSTGAVCVETLKRDWDTKLTLRDILITISCLLVQPNASSALNAEAGMLLEQGDDGWKAFDKRARFMTRLHAAIPRDLKDPAQEAQGRGNEEKKTAVDEVPERAPRTDFGEDLGHARRDRRRRGDRGRGSMQTAVQEPTKEQQHMHLTSTAASSRGEERHPPFVAQSLNDDVFGFDTPPPRQPTDTMSDTELQDADQENDATMSPAAVRVSTVASPVRQGPPVPLGELYISDDSFESEYPPSPKKSPAKRRIQSQDDAENDAQMVGVDAPISRPESSRQAAMRAPILTPQAQKDDTALSLYTITKPRQSPRRRKFPTKRHQTTDDSFHIPNQGDKVTKTRTKVSTKTTEESKKEQIEARLWNLCGQDIDRWNRGDFGGFLKLKAGRW